MRSFNVFAHCFMGKNLLGRPKFVPSTSSACFGMLQTPSYFDPKLAGKTYKDVFVDKEVYLSQYSEPETVKYQDLLIQTVNEITPTKKAQVNNKDYIEVKLLKTYDQSLIILNFIRNLWHSPPIGGGKAYHTKFFEALEKADQADPLERLTWANREACTNVLYPPGHSNVGNKKLLKLKKKDDLLKYTGKSTVTFLTT